MNIGHEMSMLEKLDISQNFLNGSIPPSMSRMASLSFLHLSSNHLSGALPTNWQALQGLTVIDLSCNNLSGTLAGFLAPCGYYRL